MGNVADKAKNAIDEVSISMDESAQNKQRVKASAGGQTAAKVTTELPKCGPFRPPRWAC